MKLADTNDQLMAMAAHRYCMGRASYIVGSCQEWIRATWSEFNPNTQNVMLRDTLQYLTDRAIRPDRFDRESWQDAARWMWAAMPQSQRDWVRDSVKTRLGAIEIVDSTFIVGQRVVARTHIFDDSDMGKPRLASAGEVLVINDLRGTNIAVSHPEMPGATFFVGTNEIRPEAGR
ncbi:hypothetical protein [Nevskia ramosa]|uniref:hypothetical protein n=1 Tax=Nevskia ramosa TaxID=64002 RepID=UPI003D0A3A62